MSALLDGVRVIEVEGARGATCARFLESLGATVERVAADKASARLAEADVLIGDRAADFREGARFDPEVLLKTNPGLVSASITPFGVTGPYADFDGPEIVVSAMGGCLGVVGYEDRPPVKEALDACGFHAEMMAAAGVLFALLERQGSGLGQHVDVSVQGVAASRMTNGILAWQFDHRLLERTGVALSYGKARVRCVWDLKDGYVFHSLMTGRFGAPANAALSAWMDEAGFDNPMKGVDWLKYDRSALDEETRGQWQAAMDRFFQSRTKAEMRTEGRRRGINACVVNGPRDVIDDVQLAAREFFGADGAASRFVRVVEGNSSPAKRGKYGEAGMGASLGGDLSVSPLVTRPHPPSGVLPPFHGGRVAPLAGVRVLDFSWALVGSITTKLLADFGAEVVKVESSMRPCLSRIDVQVAASKRGSFDDKPWFIHMNTSKQSLRLNAKHPNARDVLDPLIAWADVVVENFSPGTMKSLGLDYATLSARRPDLVMVSGSVFGQTGPLAPEWGVDGTGAALAGRLYLTGWPDRTPVTPSSVPYGDLILPPIMATSAAAAVMHARRTGRGVHIDASMYEACVQQMAPAILAARAGLRPERMGNDDPAAILQEVFPAGGRHMAVRVADAVAWEQLGRLVGGEWGAPDVMLAPARRAATEAHIRFWLERHDPWEAMAMLQQAGVAAGVVQTAADIVDRDPQLRARDFLVALDNPALGRFEHQASPIRLSRSMAAMRTAPGLGQHTQSICTSIAGMSEARFAELSAAGLFE